MSGRLLLVSPVVFVFLFLSLSVSGFVVDVGNVNNTYTTSISCEGYEGYCVNYRVKLVSGESEVVDDLWVYANSCNYSRAYGSVYLPLQVYIKPPECRLWGDFLVAEREPNVPAVFLSDLLNDSNLSVSLLGFNVSLGALPGGVVGLDLVFWGLVLFSGVLFVWGVWGLGRGWFKSAVFLFFCGSVVLVAAVV